MYLDQRRILPFFHERYYWDRERQTESKLNVKVSFGTSLGQGLIIETAWIKKNVRQSSSGRTKCLAIDGFNLESGIHGGGILISIEGLKVLKVGKLLKIAGNSD